MSTALSPQQVQLQDNMHTATCVGDVTWMENLLAAGADPNYVSTLEDGSKKMTPGMTYLHLAATTMQEDSLRVLVNWGADVNAYDQNGWTPLHRLCRNNDPEGMRTLLDAGARFDYTDNEGRSARAILEQAAQSNEDAALTCLEIIEEYRNLPRINASNEPERLKERLEKSHNGFTPLDNPLVWQEFDTIGKVLIEHDTPITKQDMLELQSDGSCYLEKAARFHQLDKALEHLRDQGERLSVDELVADQPLLDTLCEYGGVRHLFSAEQLAPEGVEGMQKLRRAVGETAMQQVPNPHALRMQLQLASQEHASGMGR